MSDDRFGTLDQYAALIEAPEPSFEGFLRRRRRQRRNKGITAGVALAVLVIAGSLFIGAGRDDGTGTNLPVGPGPLPTTAPAVDPEMFPPEGAPPSLPDGVGSCSAASSVTGISSFVFNRRSSALPASGRNRPRCQMKSEYVDGAFSMATG
jgi:hypothetical protein